MDVTWKCPSGNDSCWCGTWSVLKKIRILTKVGFEYQHSLSHHLLNLRKRFVVSKTDQTNGLSTTIIISGAYFERCPGMPTPLQILKLPEFSLQSKNVRTKVYVGLIQWGTEILEIRPRAVKMINLSKYGSKIRLATLVLFHGQPIT